MGPAYGHDLPWRGALLRSAATATSSELVASTRRCPGALRCPVRGYLNRGRRAACRGGFPACRPAGGGRGVQEGRQGGTARQLPIFSARRSRDRFVPAGCSRLRTMMPARPVGGRGRPSKAVLGHALHMVGRSWAGRTARALRWKWQLKKGPLWPREKGPPVGSINTSVRAAHAANSPAPPPLATPMRRVWPGESSWTVGTPPSRPGRKAHNCHPSRGADGVSPGGP